MAANKFATALHRNSHKMAVILVYAVLEWALILLLLLNGLFAYLIARFAAFFGLKPPCIFCSRVDHLFEPDADLRRRSGYRDLLCDDHAAEVAKLGYCSHHRRLAEAEEMCEDCCASSRPVEAAVLSWMKRSEEGEKDLRCSCCDVVLESGFYSPYVLFKPSWGAMEYDQKRNLVAEVAVGDRDDFEENAVLCQEKVEKEKPVAPDQADGCHEVDEQDEKNEENVGKEEAIGTIISEREVEEEEKAAALIHFPDACRLVEDASLEVLTPYLEYICHEERLVPVELIDSSTMTRSPVASVLGKRDQGELGHVEGEEVARILDIGSIAEERKAVAFAGKRIGIVKEDSSGHSEEEQDARCVDIGSIAEEEKGLVSATEMANLVEVNPLGNDGLEQEAMVLDVGCIIEEKKTMTSTARSVDVVEENSSEDAAVEQHADALECTRCMLEEEKKLPSAEEKADTIEAISSEMTLDTRSVSEVENALALAEERTDTIEENSSEMDEAQQSAMTLDIRSVSDMEKALVPAGERVDTIEENSSEMGETQNNAMTLDIGIVTAEGKLFVSSTEVDDILEQNSGVLSASEPVGECSSSHQFVAPLATPITTLQDGVVVQEESLMGEFDLPKTQAYKEDNKLIDVETNCEISIGSEICDQEHDDAHLHEPILMSEITQDELSESEMTAIEQEILVTEIEPMVTTSQSPDHIAIFRESNDIEEERQPETPTSVDGSHGLHKRFLFGRRESGTESLDGSVASEFEGCETLTADQLKAALKAERKTLSALYAELEEERSAAAIAANQTMAMITRLQEEKAAMQMEALQYQRMMDEQSEYDQEALQLLNELMMKREKEKQDLEKELEVYRKKVLRYEAKERRQMAKHKVNGRAGTSSASSSAEDSDDLSFEFQEGDEFAYSPDESNQNTPADAVLSSGTDQSTVKHLITLNESLADFEEERLSILEELKALERKLLTLDDEDPHNLVAAERVSDGNGHVPNGNHVPQSDDLDDDMNGFSDELEEANRKLHGERRSTGCKGKRLLPLFDAMSNENEDDIDTKEEAADASPETISNIAQEQKKHAIVEEVDDIYERLHALEADREFLKHCIGSLKKGDKGIHLLQEILEHLRDLRSVELRARDSCDAFASFAA